MCCFFLQAIHVHLRAMLILPAHSFGQLYFVKCYTYDKNKDRLEFSTGYRNIHKLWYKLWNCLFLPLFMKKNLFCFLVMCRILEVCSLVVYAWTA